MNDAAGGGERRQSLFSGMKGFGPEPEPAPAPAGGHADAQLPASLVRRLDALEKNITLLLEKRLAAREAPPAQALPIPAPPAGGDAAALRGRLEAIEKRLASFQEGGLADAARLRDIENSRGEARREIAELLKAVREQQKQTELDRQTREQLERAWRRAEETEKRLLDFFSSAMNRFPDREEPERREKEPPALEKRMASLEDSVRAFRPETAGEKAAAMDAVVRGLRELWAGLEERLAGLFKVSAGEQLSRMDELRKTFSGGLWPLQSGLSALEETFRAETARALSSGERDLETVTAALAGLRKEAGAAAREVRDDLEGRLSALGAIVEGLAAEIRLFPERTGRMLAEERVLIGGELKLLSGAAQEIKCAACAAEGVTESLAALEGLLSSVAADLEKLSPDSMAGVSGVISRRCAGNIRAGLSELRARLEDFRKAEEGLSAVPGGLRRPAEPSEGRNE